MVHSDAKAADPPKVTSGIQTYDYLWVFFYGVGGVTHLDSGACSRALQSN